MTPLEPFLKVAREIPKHWADDHILWFGVRQDGTLFLDCYGAQARQGGITVGQWRALLTEDAANVPTVNEPPT